MIDPLQLYAEVIPDRSVQESAAESLYKEQGTCLGKLLHPSTCNDSSCQEVIAVLTDLRKEFLHMMKQKKMSWAVTIAAKIDADLSLSLNARQSTSGPTMKEGGTTGREGDMLRLDDLGEKKKSCLEKISRAHKGIIKRVVNEVESIDAKREAQLEANAINERLILDYVKEKHVVSRGGGDGGSDSSTTAGALNGLVAVPASAGNAGVAEDTVDKRMKELEKSIKDGVSALEKNMAEYKSLGGFNDTRSRAYYGVSNSINGTMQHFAYPAQFMLIDLSEEGNGEEDAEEVGGGGVSADTDPCLKFLCKEVLFPVSTLVCGSKKLVDKTNIRSKEGNEVYSDC